MKIIYPELSYVKALELSGLLAELHARAKRARGQSPIAK